MPYKNVERFAPSPTGPLHLGHAYSALTAARHTQQFLVRMEDIDTARCRPEWEAMIYDDLRWLGLDWSEPVLRQSDRLPLYHAAVAQLQNAGLTYRCTCTRADIKAALSAPQEGAPMHGPDGLIYPGTCRDACHNKPDAAIRLNMAAAISYLGDVSRLHFTELDAGNDGQHGDIYLNADHLLHSVGDIVLARKDIGTSYHVAVVVDDAAQGITHVTRGRDLFSATPLHRLLQALLNLPTPLYRHHRLIRDQNGKRLAKRDDARALSTLRAEGWTRADVLNAIELT